MEAELEFLRDKVEQLKSMILFIQAEVHEKLAVILQGFFKHKTANVAEQKRELQLEENMYLKLLDGCTTAVDNCSRFKIGSRSGLGRDRSKVRSATPTRATPVTSKSTSTSASTSTHRKRQCDKNSSPSSSGQSNGRGKRKYYVSNSDQDSLNDGYENEADQIGIINLPVLRNSEAPMKSGSGRTRTCTDVEHGDGGDYEIKTEILDQDDELDNQSPVSGDQEVVDSESASSSIYTFTKKRSSQDDSITNRNLKGRGRNRNPVWKHFTINELRSGQKRATAKCNFCQLIVSGEAPRLTKHLKKCNKEIARQEGSVVETMNKLYSAI